MSRIALIGIIILMSVAFYVWYTHAYDIEVLCEKKSINDDNKIQVIDYSVRPAPSLNPYIGGTGRYNALISNENGNNRFLVKETYIESDQLRRICNMSIVSKEFKFVHPVVNVYKDSQLAGYIKRYKQAGSGDSIIYNGSQWIYTKIETNEDGKIQHTYFPGRKLTAWVTSSIAYDGVNLIAHQVAADEKIIENYNKRPYMPLPAYTIFQMYAYNESVDFGAYGKYPELRPVVKRRLVSNDKGISWIEENWEIVKYK